MQHIKDWREGRRLRALELYKKGWLQKGIAEALGVTKGAVSQWVKRFKNLVEEDQAQTLRGTKGTGRHPLLSAEQRAQLVALIKQGAEALGFSGDVWTATRVQSIAHNKLQVRLGLTTIKNFLHAEGFSVQKPKVKATQQNEEAVTHFRANWAEVKKKPLRKG